MQIEVHQRNTVAVSCGWFVEAGHGESESRTKLFFHEMEPDLTTFFIKYRQKKVGKAGNVHK